MRPPPGGRTGELSEGVRPQLRGASGHAGELLVKVIELVLWELEAVNLLIALPRVAEAPPPGAAASKSSSHS